MTQKQKFCIFKVVKMILGQVPGRMEILKFI